MKEGEMAAQILKIKMKTAFGLRLGKNYESFNYRKKRLKEK